MMLSMPNASRRRLFDAQPKRSAAAPSMVIHPNVIYVNASASRTSSERCRTRFASFFKPTCSILSDIYGADGLFTALSLCAGYYIPLQQHLSTSFFASLQNNFPFFCCSQQHIFTSLPVRVHVILGEAANALPIRRPVIVSVINVFIRTA